MHESDPFHYYFDSLRNFDDLKTSFNKAEEGANDGDLWTMEVYSNEAIRVLDDTKMKLLFINVNGYLQHGEFRKAYAAAEVIAKTAERSKGVAQLFHILMKEKRYWDMIELYNTLKSREGNEGFPLYLFEDYGIAELQQQAMKKLKESHGIDLMKKLPQEIVTLILDQLDFHDVVNCLQVSKDWRHHICNSSAVCRQNVILNYEARQKSGSLPTEFYKSSIRLLSDGIKSLKIPAHCEKLQMEVVDTLAGVPFNNLQVLDIENAAWFSDEQFKNLLQGFSHSLEELYIQCGPLTFNEILDVCPNLKKLHYRVYQMPVRKQSQTQPQHPSLTYLYIDIHHYSIAPIEEFKQVLERAINLQEITIVDRGVSVDTLRLINRYGSKHLRHICINTPSDLYNTSFDSDVYSDTVIDTSRFHYTVDVHNCLGLTAEILLPLVNHSMDMKHKLSAVSFTLVEDSRLQDWSSFRYFTSPCLRFMRFSFTKETEDVFATVIHNCPTLEEVSIFRLLCPPSNITMDALKALPALKCFAIENVASELFDHGLGNIFVAECIEYVPDTVIQEFFTYHVLMDNRSTLEEVRLRHISGFKLATFDTLFKIKSLKRLNFAGRDILGYRQDFGSAITSIKGSLLPVQLEHLVLDEVQNITDYDLQFLDFPSITLATMDDWTITGIKQMIEHAKKLKELTFCDCGGSKTVAELKDIAKRYNIQINLS